MDIIMKLDFYGWLDVFIYTSGGKEIEIPVSYLTDAIHELSSKISVIDQINGDTIITVQTEPGEYRLRILRVTDEACLFQVFEMDDNFSTQHIEEGTLLVSEEIEAIRLLRIIHRELSKMKDLGHEEFKERWGSDFPDNAYERISTLIKKANNTEANFKQL